MIVEAVFAFDAIVGRFTMPMFAFLPDALQQAQEGCQHTITPQDGW